MQAFERGHAFFMGAAAFFLLFSILCRFITGVILKKLNREAENMSATENRLLKQCKLKFRNCYELNGGSVNAGVFVEKFMQGIRVGKCSLRLINQLSGQFLLLSVFADGIGSCLGLAHGETLGQVLPYYLQAFLSLYAHFGLSGLIDVPGKREALKITVTDFLENRMPERIRNARQDSARLEEEERKALREAGKPVQNGAAGQGGAEEENGPATDASTAWEDGAKGAPPAREGGDGAELERLLREFLA